MLEGTFDQNTGGTFVRNPNWDGAKDPVRKAYPDKIVIPEGIQAEPMYQRLVAGSGRRHGYHLQPGSSSVLRSSGEPVGRRRSATTAAPYVDYLTPNMIGDDEEPEDPPGVRHVTNRDAYINANGGSQS